MKYKVVSTIKSSPIKCYELVSEYNPDTATKWKEIKMPFEDAIKKYSGLSTLMIKWEEGDIIKSFEIPKPNDRVSFAEKVATDLIKEFKRSILKSEI